MGKPEDHRIELTHLEPVRVAGLRQTTRYSEIGKLFFKLGFRVGRWICGPACTLYHDDRADPTAEVDLEVCFPVKEAADAKGVNIRVLPATRAVTLTHQGPYDRLSDSYARLIRYVEEEGLDVQLPTREIYVKGPGRFLKGDPEGYLTELQFPLRGDDP